MLVFIVAYNVMKMSFQIRLFVSLALFSLVLSLVLGGMYYTSFSRQLYEHMGERAKIQAEEIALIPTLRLDVLKNDTEAIKLLMEKLAARSDASFIVIGDTQGRHLYHSVFDDRVGTALIGGDNTEVLAGKSIVTLRRGGLG